MSAGVCRTDLHIVDGDLAEPVLPLVLGHQIVGVVDALGEGTDGVTIGDRVGVPWLGWTCGVCGACTSGRENLCPNARFTGYQLPGGYAELAVADARYCFPAPGHVPRHPGGAAAVRRVDRVPRPADRRRRASGSGSSGSAARRTSSRRSRGTEGRRVFAFTRPGDVATQAFARELGAEWAGGSTEAAAGAARRRDRVRGGR